MHSSLHPSGRLIKALTRKFRTMVLGIETSCDDTAVAIVDEKRNVLARSIYVDREIQARLGGIAPMVAAEQHRTYLRSMIDDCMKQARCQLQDLSAVAVTNRPGLVIALRAGVHEALSLARRARVNVIPVHHMRAHALSALLVNERIQFPFMTVLISGGHCIFSVCKAPNDFDLLGTSISGSPGECLDKIGRELNVSDLPEYRGIHVGAAMERLAASASPHGHLRYKVNGPLTSGADTNFSSLKASFLGLIERDRDSLVIEDFCASVQYSLTRHIASKFHSALHFLHDNGTLEKCNYVVVGGGVASNSYIANALLKIANYYGIKLFQLPKQLCTDNGEMIAWTGMLLLNSRSPDIINYEHIPDQIYCHFRDDIGKDLRAQVGKPKTKISYGSLHGCAPLKLAYYSE